MIRPDLRTFSTLTVDDHLASFTPVREQAILIEAGVVHALGDGVVVMEVAPPERRVASSP